MKDNITSILHKPLLKTFHKGVKMTQQHTKDSHDIFSGRFLSFAVSLFIHPDGVTNCFNNSEDIWMNSIEQGIKITKEGVFY
jgi:hypothetical protein